MILNFVYNRENAGQYPLNYSSKVYSYLGYELHREVTYLEDDIHRHFYIVNPDDEVALIPWSWYNEIDKKSFEVIVYGANETYVT